MTIEDRLKQELMRSDMNIPAIARKSQVAHDSIYRFLAGGRSLRLDTASKICELLGLELRGRNEQGTTRVVPVGRSGGP